LIETLAVKKRRASNIYALLKSTYPNFQSPINYYQPHELLIANILLQYSSYEQVNMVTKTLYKKYQSIIDFAYCNLESLESDIGRIENHKQKAENIKQSCSIIIDDYKSVLPVSHDDLIKLPGIETDSANMMLSEIYNIPSLILDNHVKRIVTLLKFTRSHDLEKIRDDIAEIFEEMIWTKLTYLISKHGVQICIEIGPKCEMCILNKLCPSSSV
tara:strand:+ start:195 stop:839 length:645 start_codon:yes stop_codon:yes gene_type:complete